MYSLRNSAVPLCNSVEQKIQLHREPQSSHKGSQRIQLFTVNCSLLTVHYLSTILNIFPVLPVGPRLVVTVT